MSSDHTPVKKIIQERSTSDLDSAVQLFNEIYSDGSTPLVLAPSTRSSCSCCLNIPTGSSPIVQRCGADDGDYAPGFHCVPSWVNVVFLVNKQSCTYYYSVNNCPTKDNVMVSVEVTLVFRVIKAKLFIYSLGATKFDEALKAVSEEAIRAEVRHVKHNHIYELRGSGAQELLKVLNSKFEAYGVLFSNATFVNVQLPSDLADALQNATTFEAKMRQQIRSQEFALKVLNDENDQQLKALYLENERMNAAELARKERVLIDLDIKKAEGDRQKQLAIINAQREISVQKTEAQTALDTETSNAKADMDLRIKRQHGEAQAKKIEVEQTANAEKIFSEASFIEATNKAKAIALQADAEMKVYEQLSQKRQFDLQMASAKALQNVAARGKLIISGKNGKSILDSITANISLSEKKGQ